VLVGAGAALVLAIGVLAVLRRAGVDLAAVTDLATAGGEKVLREPMRPTRGGSRVVVFALDGVGADELRDAVAGGGAPTIAALLGAPSGDDGLYAHAYAADSVLSILPSTTVAAWTSLFTGEPPARTGVPGNEWFVREEMRFYAPAPVSATEASDAVGVYADDLVGTALRVPTLYVSLSQVHRGADLLTIPDAGALGGLVTAVARGVAGGAEVEQEAFVELDRQATGSLVESIRTHGIPDLLVVYLPGVDLFTHVADDPLPDQREYLREVIDAAVGEVLSVYRDAGALDETYVLFVSDHGHTPVLDDDRNALGTDGDGEPPAVLEKAGFRLRPFVVTPEPDEQDYQATVAYQGAFAYVYLADRSTCPRPGTRCDWTRPPRLEEDVLPVVRAFDAANRSGAEVPELRGAFDLILAREPRAPSEEALPFEVWDGERLVPLASYLEANPRPELLDFERRMEGLAAGPFGHRAGDVLLLARSGAHLPIEERFYFSGLYTSWHGSPTDQDSRIPLVLARLSSSGVELRERMRAAVGDRPSQLDITRLILALLDGSTGGL
jgi:hypothetical protein